ncbi:MAG: capsular biosynthesis protein [Tissierellia bacterium]|nr:capsular biosynthesis protein [Tissierellia bacterium]
MEEISFKEIFSILRRRLWLIILLLILFMLASGLVSYYVIDKKYEASTTLMIVTTDEIEYNEILLNQKLASIYSELIKTRAVANKVIENLKLRISYEQYKSKVKVNFVEDAGLIRIQVSDKNPKLAADIANEIALVFIEDVKRVMRVENIQVIDEAQVPTKPVSPKPVLNISIAGILGFMIGVFISFLKEYLDNTIKSYEDVEKYLELQVLGAIPKFKV